MIQKTLSYFEGERLKQIIAYQFRITAEQAKQLIPSTLIIEISKKTHRTRYLYLNNELWGIIRPNDGFFLLTPASARSLLKLLPFPKQRVIVQSEVAPYILKGGNVFAKHVVDCDSAIIPGLEVIAVDEKDTPLAIGRAQLNKHEMLSFSNGVAVKVRKGLAP
jgi:predicted RNA-binding protein (TIGR00451 family)